MLGPRRAFQLSSASHIQIELFRNRLRQTKEQTIHRLQVRGIELLEVR
jgi:hypothetical protein